MTFYRSTLPHIQRDHAPHFITFVTWNRWFLPESVRDIVLACCTQEHQQRFFLFVAVVMPDHVHLVLTPCIDEQRNQVWSLTQIVRDIKSSSAHLVNRALQRHGSVWQHEWFDSIVEKGNLDQKIRYVKQNPIAKALATSERGYSWLWAAEAPNPYAPDESIPRIELPLMRKI